MPSSRMAGLLGNNVARTLRVRRFPHGVCGLPWELFMPCRRGATLIEVLVAIFVMGIGLIALLTLFPLGALRMAQAIQDDRCASAARNAMAVATMRDVRNDPAARTPPWFPKADVFKDALPDQGRQLPADPDGPSYPVFVDPWGVKSALFGTPAQFW